MESYSHGIKLKDYPARGRRRHLGSRPPASVQIGPAHPPTAFHRHSDETLLSPPGAGPHGADGGHVYARELHLRRSRERLALPVRAHVALYWAGSFCRHVEIFGTARGDCGACVPKPQCTTGRARSPGVSIHEPATPSGRFRTPRWQRRSAARPSRCLPPRPFRRECQKLRAACLPLAG